MWLAALFFGSMTLTKMLRSVSLGFFSLRTLRFSVPVILASSFRGSLAPLSLISHLFGSCAPFHPPCSGFSLVLLFAFCIPSGVFCPIYPRRYLFLSFFLPLFAEIEDFVSPSHPLFDRNSAPSQITPAHLSSSFPIIIADDPAS